MPRLRSDFDTAWKEVLEAFLEEALAFFFPHIHSEIDWSRAPVFLEQELRRLVKRRRRGLVVVDVLAQVWRRTGEETRVLLHAEVQGQQVPGFGKRMHLANTLISSDQECPVVSLGILADAESGWRPESYEFALWGCELRFQFPTAKLLDWTERWRDLEESRNVFAVVVMAHLLTLQTQGNWPARREHKFRLVRMLHERGFPAERIRMLFRFLDLVMVLPGELQYGFEQDVIRYERERKMPVLTPFERNAMRRATIATGREDLMEVLEVRFKSVPEAVVRKLEKITGPRVLRRLHREAITVESLEAFERLLPKAG